MEKIQERIAKLLALAANNSNEAEATAAMAKARELMLQYAIEEIPDLKERPNVIVVTFDAGRTFYKWQKVVQSAVGRLFDGTSIFTRVWDSKNFRWIDVVHVVCAAFDAPYIKPAFQQVVAEISTASHKYSKKPAERNSYQAGAAAGFYHAVVASRNTVTMTEQTTAIVHLKSEAVERFIEDRWGKNLKSKDLKSSISDRSAYYDGFDHGRNISANTRKTLTE